jgi:hypothetical protein
MTVTSTTNVDGTILVDVVWFGADEHTRTARLPAQALEPAGQTRRAMGFERQDP